MLSIRSFTILCAVTVAVSLAAVFAGKDSEAIPGSGRPLFPDLMAKINGIGIIEARGSGGSFQLKRTQGGWVVPDKADYPANADKVHQLLVGAAGLERVEPKTTKPELYPKLGLTDPGAEDSKAMSFHLKGENGATLASLIVGDSAPAKGDPDLKEFYVRVPGEPRSWLVEGKLPRGDSLIDWTAREVIDVDRARLRELSVEHASGEVVTVRKTAPSDNDFVLSHVPEGRSVDAQWKLNDLGRLLAALEFEDVRPKADAPLGKDPEYIVLMRTFDGLEVEMKVHASGGKAFGVLGAEFNEDAAEAQGNSGAASTAPETVRAEVEALNARWNDWAYALPDFKLDALSRTRDDLLKRASGEDPAPQGG